MKEQLGRIVGTLDELAGIETVLPRGAVHPGGPHYRLKGTLGPISIGMDECRVLAAFIEDVKPRNCLIIGNAFGLSSVFIAGRMALNDGVSVVTLDNQSEGDGERLAAIAETLRRRMQCHLLVNHKGASPEDIERVAGGRKFDFILIDGLHRHPQVTRDFFGVQPVATDEAVLWWHDYWMLGIPQSVEEAGRAAYHCLKVNTSCEMVFGTRNRALFERVAGLYENTEQPRRRWRPRAFLKVCYAVGSAVARAPARRWRAATKST